MYFIRKFLLIGPRKSEEAEENRIVEALGMKDIKDTRPSKQHRRRYMSYLFNTFNLFVGVSLELV